MSLKMIWRWFFPPLSLIVWFTVTALVGMFWFETRGIQQAAWALALVVWVLITPYLAIFVSCIVTILTIGGGHPHVAEFYARVATAITRVNRTKEYWTAYSKRQNFSRTWQFA